MTQPAIGFMLYVNGKPQSFHNDFDSAIAAGSMRRSEATALRIESTWGAVRVWHYDREVDNWVEKV
jgi:hypothetical protein